MSENIRQNNLFAAEDWKVIYNAFRNVNLQAYDYQSIYEALVGYLQANNPEEFNDYIKHSEMIAHINMISYLGQSLAFRIDLNARENFFDTAERRESVIKLARSLSYHSKRNRAANGLCKLTAVKTTQPILNNEGTSLANRNVIWNQASEPNWYDNFVKILNASFSSTNLFGEPIMKENISNINTELYSIEKAPNNEIVFKFNEVVNGTSYNFETVSSYISNNQIVESAPDINAPFNIIYKNDGNGNTSKDSGFFIQIKQGSLGYTDFNYPNPRVDIRERISINNINETDVWLQEINQNGNVLEHWTKVPSLTGQNVIYNDIFLKERNIYAVETANNNQINIQFSDGNFGNMPVGLFRVWHRRSENESYVIRPNDIFNKSVMIPYVGSDNQVYQLTLTFTLYDTIQNAEEEESIDDIKQNAPLVHYTQDRMVNSEDYNVFPITQTNVVRKVKTVNRTHAGHSRYIDITDPTGAHSNTTVVGEDGYLYNDYKNNEMVERIQNNTNFQAIIYDNIEEIINEKSFENFFYHNFRKTILSETSENNGGYGDDYYSYFEKYYWNTLPENQYSTTGYFTTGNSDNSIEIGKNTSNKDTKFLRKNTKVKFTNGKEYKWCTINDVNTKGIVNEEYATTGPVHISNTIGNGWYIEEIIPGIRNYFSTEEKTSIVNELENNRSFGLRYDVVSDDWIIISQDNIANTTNQFDLIAPNLPSQPDNRWLIKAILTNTDAGKIYTFNSRGTRFIFGSDRQVRFFFKNTETIIDVNTGKYLKDNISLLKSNISHVKDNNNYTIFSRITKNNYNNDNINITNYITNENDIIQIGNNLSYQSMVIVVADNNTKRVYRIGYGETNFKKNGSQYNVQLPSRYNGKNISVEFGIVGESQPPTLDRSYAFSLNDSYIQGDGTVDYSKVLVSPLDDNTDGVPDYPLAYEEIVSDDDLVFFSNNNSDDTSNANIDNKVIRLSQTSTLEENVVYYADINVNINNKDGKSIRYTKGHFYKGIQDRNNISMNEAKLLENNTDSVLGIIYTVFNGRSFNTDDPLLYQWNHYAGKTDRIDPSISNIMDMYVLTKEYDTQVRTWLRNRLDVNQFPSPPTTDTIRNSINSIEKNKSTSDQIIYIPAKYKILFGQAAKSEYRARFKLIKTPGSTLTDNEIKSEVIDAIGRFFNIDNWDFGEGFYYTELSSYIHQELSGNISSIVIVPQFENSKFGDLFEIKAEPSELFLSTASVDNIEIVSTYTDFNLRK